MADEVVARAERRADTSITVDSSEGATFPWAWYFRDLPAGYVELGAGSTAPAPDSDVLILTQAAHDRLGPQLAGLRGARVPVPRLVGARLRRDVTGAPGGAGSPTREPWNPTGGMPEWLYERR